MEMETNKLSVIGKNITGDTMRKETLIIYLLIYCKSAVGNH
jgi:hypothetical protein